MSSWWWLGSKARKPEELHHQEATTEAEDVVDWYHGTEVHNLPRILSEGLRPSVAGAGAYAVQQHYGLVVPAVYVTPSFQTATTYPTKPNAATIPVQGQRKHASIFGRTLVADDGSFPLRAVVQMRGRRD